MRPKAAFALSAGKIPTRPVTPNSKPMRMIRRAPFLAVTVLATVPFSVSAHAQTRGAATQQASGSDFTEGNLKFHRAGNFYQVTDTDKNQSAGTVIIQPGGAPMYAAMPGYDLKSAYEKHMNGGGSASAAPAAVANNAAVPTAAPAPSASAPALGFDAASKTVTLSGDRSVTFTDNDDLTVQLPGPAGTKTYTLRYHGKGAGGAAKSWADSEQGRVGGSLSGSGVVIILEGANGMPGGQIYDTARGQAFRNSGMEQAKSVTAAVREASDVVKATQPDLAKSNVVKSLLSNNLGL